MAAFTSDLAQTLAAGTFAALASLAGVGLVQLRPAWTRAGALPLAAFSSGVILGAAFLHLLPEALERGGRDAAGIALLAFLALYVFETHVVAHEHHGHEPFGRQGHRDTHLAATAHAAVPAEAHAAHAHAWNDETPAAAPLALIAGVAFALHSAFDGLALGVGHAPAVSLGAATSLGVLAHKIPEGIALASLLLRGGLSTARAFVVALAIAILTPIAAVAAHLFLGNGIPPETMGTFLAVVAGSFVYVASFDLLPEVAHHPKFSRTFLLGGGVGVTWVLLYLGE